jgi:hypothetical protein
MKADEIMTAFIYRKDAEEHKEREVSTCLGVLAFFFAPLRFAVRCPRRSAAEFDP